MAQSEPDYSSEVIDIERLFQGNPDNTIHEITYEQIEELLRDNKREEAKGSVLRNCQTVVRISTTPLITIWISI